jgi:hypothetical protein
MRNRILFAAALALLAWGAFVQSGAIVAAAAGMMGLPGVLGQQRKDDKNEA